MSNSTPDIPILDDDAVGEIEAACEALKGVKDACDITHAKPEFVDYTLKCDPARVFALCQTVRALRADKAEQRGLTLISALVNFADWLHAEGLLSVDDERKRAQLVLKFFDAHSEGEHYFMQAEQIMEILGQPFQETQ